MSKFLTVSISLIAICAVSGYSFDDSFVESDLYDHGRYVRQVSGSLSPNLNGGQDLKLMTPLAVGANHALGATAFGSGIGGPHQPTFGGGLAYENAGGHGASLTGSHNPNLGNSLTAAGRLNLVNTPDHRLDANAFHTSTFLKNGPTMNTNGGSLDYLFQNKHGASLGVSNNDLMKATTWNAAARSNLWQSPDRATSLDFSAGASKTSSPYLSNSNWQPFGMFGLTHRF